MSKLKELFELLAKEKEVYDKLLQIANEKKRVIVTNQLKTLEQMTAQEQGYIKAVVQLEKLRTKVVEELSRQYDAQHIERLSDLVPYLSNKDQSTLNDLKDELSVMIQSLSEANTLNGDLIDQSLEFIEFSYELYQNMQSAGTNYDETAGENKLENKKPLFDVKV